MNRRDTLYQLDIPSLGQFSFEHIVFDFNGTLAAQGQMPEHLVKLLSDLSCLLDVHVLTKDTFQNVRVALKETHVLVAIVDEHGGTEAKLRYIEELGTHKTIAVGNGSVDSKMLKAAGLGIAVIGHEGLSAKAMKDADLIFGCIEDVFATLLNPLSLIATLRE